MDTVEGPNLSQDQSNQIENKEAENILINNWIITTQIKYNSMQ